MVEDLRRFIEYAPVAIAMLDRDMRYLTTSRRWRTDYGLPDGDLRGQRHYDVFPEIPEHWKAVHRRCLAGAAVANDGELFIRHDGSRQWIRWAIQPWQDASGSVGGIIIFSEDITSRKEAEAAVRRSEAKTRAMFDSLVEGVVFLNTEGEVVDANEAVRNQGHTLEQLTDPDQDPRHRIVRLDGSPFPVADQPAMVALRTGRAVQNVEMGVPTIDGQLVWRLVNAQPIYDDEEQLLGAVASFFDITERKRSEQAVRESERRLRLALDTSAAGVWSWDVRTNRMIWDARCYALHGLEPSVQSPSFDDWVAHVHDEDRTCVLGRLDQILHTSGDDEWKMEFRVVHADGTIVWLYCVGGVERDALGTATRMTGIILDVTSRRAAEAELAKSREQQRDSAETAQLLFATATQGIVTVDDDGVIIAANTALETMFGWRPGELIGQRVERLVPSSHRDRHVQHRAVYQAAPLGRPMGLGLDLVAERKDGVTFPVEVSLNHVTTSMGRRVIAFVTDITARKRAEYTLRQQRDELAEHTRVLRQRTAQLRRLASDLTLAEQRAREQLARTLHDHLQQLLFSATLKLDRLSTNDSDRPPAAAELLSRAKNDLTEAIAASRSLAVELFPPVLHEGGLPAALSWLTGWMKDKYGLIVDLAADPEANPLRKDIRTLVFESVRELLFNAVKHAKVDRVAVAAVLTSDEAIRITVADEGVGFDATKSHRSASGHQGGLGIFAIRERLALLGGHLDVESSPGAGTRFTLTVPRAGVDRRSGVPAVAHPTDPSQERWPEKSDVDGPTRILIVDDHPVVREGLRTLLAGRREFQIVGEAADGIGAVAKADALRPHIIVMDVSMPQMGGVEATRRILAELPSIEIIGLSAEQVSDDSHPMSQAGAKCCFVKGDDPGRLLDRLLVSHARRGRRSLERPGPPHDVRWRRFDA